MSDLKFTTAGDYMKRAGEASVISADDIYECLACGKMYTAEAMYVHEDVCPKIPEYLALKAKQEHDGMESDGSSEPMSDLDFSSAQPHWN